MRGIRIMRRFAVIIVLLLGLFGVADLFRPGFFSSHDGMGHVIRMGEFFRSFQDGPWPVRWSERLYWGYGYPFFNFNYPLVYYFGLPLMAVGFSAADAVKTEFIVTFLLSGVFMYGYLARKVKIPYAVLGAVLYLYAPYRLLNIYVRGSVAEAAAFVFPPLLLWGAELIAQKNKRGIFLTALVFGFLEISHNISALLLTGFFFAYLVFLAMAHKSWRILVRGIISFLWGAALAAFFLIPALYEKRWTFLDLTLAKDYPSYFISPLWLLKNGWGFGGVTASAPGGEPGMSLSLGYAGLVLSLLSLAVIRQNLLVKFCFLILPAAVFFMLPVSRFLWDHVPLLPFVQFPWRFLMLTVPALAVTGAIGAQKILSRLPDKLQVLGVAVLIATTLFLSKDKWSRNLTEPAPDFSGDAIAGSTTWAHEQATRWLVPKPNNFPANKIENARSQITTWETGRHDYAVFANKNTVVTENTMYYPGWQVWVDGEEKDVNFTNGKINYPVGAGDHRVVTVFTETPLRQAADLISLTALGLLLGYVILQIFPQHQPGL